MRGQLVCVGGIAMVVVALLMGVKPLLVGGVIPGVLLSVGVGLVLTLQATSSIISQQPMKEWMWRFCQVECMVVFPLSIFCKDISA
jgi:multisubunit Na+/H+ antiporter MnhB subunit